MRTPREALQGYRAPLWLPGGHAQTIWAAVGARRTIGPLPVFARERWDTPDGDFIDVDLRPAADPAAPWLVLFHGLEGSSSSQYAQAFAEAAAERGWSYAVPHFRGCSGELNRAPRAYHSGDHVEIDWILRRLRERTAQPLRVVGISLGGNALLRWAGEQGEQAATVATSVAAVCSPLDLAAGGHAIGRGLNRQIYTRMFLRSMKPKALAKLVQHPGLFDEDRMRAARDLYEFDQLFTAPLHGFASTEDYWARASAKPHLGRIRIPALALNARNDPFIPAGSLPVASGVSRFVSLWQPPHGGHVGFPFGRPPGHVHTMPRAVTAWLDQPEIGVHHG
ncbi:YheT family hydrolase [Ideonella sp.]|uniref:YheT family hydrolase n=1 Tax=Ideonella sp. TaxID=1929293 RepID=UPI003BB5DEB4